MYPRILEPPPGKSFFLFGPRGTGTAWVRANLPDALDLGYSLSYWRTQGGTEVDFVIYGERGLFALEVTRSRSLRGRDLTGLRAFLDDYPMARCALIYGGSRAMREGTIDVWPIEEGIANLRGWLSQRE